MDNPLPESMLIGESDSHTKSLRDLNMERKKLFKIAKKIAVRSTIKRKPFIFWWRREENQSDNNQFISSIKYSKAESKYDDHRACLNSLRNEIKELRNDIKICMEKIVVPLNAIANYIIKRQESENEVLNVDNNINLSLRIKKYLKIKLLFIKLKTLRQ